MVVLFFRIMELKVKIEKDGGMYIPEDVLKDNRLDWFEKFMLAIYRTYGTDITCNEMLDALNRCCSRSTYQRAKRHLRELELIVCDETPYTKENLEL